MLFKSQKSNYDLFSTTRLKRLIPLTKALTLTLT